MTDEQAQAIQEAFNVVAEFIRDAWDAIVEAMQKVYALFYDCYTEAGAVYGDTHEGMLRWYGELATIVRLRQEADAIEQRHARRYGELATIVRLRQEADAIEQRHGTLVALQQMRR